MDSTQLNVPFVIYVDYEPITEKIGCKPNYDSSYTEAY